AHDDDRLRFPPTSPARNSKTGKKESTGRRLNRPCPPCATPFSKFSLAYRRSDARIVENGFAASSGMSKSAKVVLALLWQILSGTGFPNQFFCDSWVVGFGGADHGWKDVGLERRAWTLSQAVSGSVGSQGAATNVST